MKNSNVVKLKHKDEIIDTNDKVKTRKKVLINDELEEILSFKKE